MHHVRLAQPDTTVDEDGVVGHARVLRDLYGGGARQLVGTAGDQVVEGESRVQARAVAFVGPAAVAFIAVGLRVAVRLDDGRRRDAGGFFSVGTQMRLAYAWRVGRRRHQYGCIGSVVRLAACLGQTQAHRYRLRKIFETERFDARHIALAHPLQNEAVRGDQRQ